MPRSALVLVALTIVSAVVCVTGFAVRQVGVGVSAASVTLLVTGLVLSGLTSESRRIRDAERGGGGRRVAS
ncbi:LapA family protein [Candidatus Mycobacterium wuenschmannii]|uniref:LapA family protein n=1 Tax=Candidatus Mycobacterium wuenschmannii TaxID=3027808 RepID=A0ABY8VZ50_9MYCO|nr:LapA family protein [Candidatus Mycobacterium wuenschmannii]WIM88923.1 LapA family protein [Candidatus Mycobacterium wuenschmannii]